MKLVVPRKIVNVVPVYKSICKLVQPSLDLIPCNVDYIDWRFQSYIQIDSGSPTHKVSAQQLVS